MSSSGLGGVPNQPDGDIGLHRYESGSRDPESATRRLTNRPSLCTSDPFL